MNTTLEINWFRGNKKGLATRAALIHPNGRITRYSIKEIEKMIKKMITAKNAEAPESIIFSHPNVMALHLLNFHTANKGFVRCGEYSGVMNKSRRQIMFILEKRGKSATE